MLQKVSFSNIPPKILFDSRPKAKVQTNTKQNGVIGEIPLRNSDIPFMRKWKEHKSWGATVDPKTKEVSFKLFTFPDVKKVTVTVIKKEGEKTAEFNLKNKGGGVFERENIPPAKATHGDSYYFSITRKAKDGTYYTEKVKDPYSNRQKQMEGKSVIYDHSLYQWQDKDWFSESNGKRISRIAGKGNNHKGLSASSMQEIHIGTLTPEGTFEAAKRKLDEIADLKFNTVSIMPVENTFSFNWGYDGADKFAVSEHLGGPDGLKSFVDYAHSIGLNVIMDVVPNHSGEGSQLLKTGPYADTSHNKFGLGYDFEGENSRYVRDYMVNAIINWIDNYHCDGVRLDCPWAMHSDFTLKQIISEVNFHKPNAVIILEDGRGGVDSNGEKTTQNADNPNDERLTFPLGEKEGLSEEEHCEIIDEIAKNKGTVAKIGADANWYFYWLHTNKEAMYGNVQLDDIEKANQYTGKRVRYIGSHDEIGNYEGVRLIPKLMLPKLDMTSQIELNNYDIRRAQELYRANANVSSSSNIPYGQEEYYTDDMRRALNVVKIQKAGLLCEKLAIMFQEGKFDAYENIEDERFIREQLLPLGVKGDTTLTYRKIKKAFDEAYSIQKMATARLFATPGAKMVFQGDDKVNLEPFRFFRQLSPNDQEDRMMLEREKGYRAGESAFIESKMGTIKYGKKGKEKMSAFSNLIKDLNTLNAQNPALGEGVFVKQVTDKNYADERKIPIAIKDYASDVIAFHIQDKKSNNNIFSVSNYSQKDYPNYKIKFPEGSWVEVVNTDDKKYCGSGITNADREICANGEDECKISLAAYTTAIFKKV